MVYKDLVLDESIDIMNWAKNKKIINHKNKCIRYGFVIKRMIKINDGEFKNKLDLYKYTSNKDYDLKKKIQKRM